MATNPRIDDLRRRLEKEPNSRLFAQLAEELRKDGEFEEAIRIARAGLARHPAYPSARMTLGRALFDTGDMAAARQELESVLEGAPDNILASRLLAECLEALGDLEGALARYRATLALSPGDKQISARVRDLEGRLQSAARPAAAPAPAPGAPPGAEPAPIPLSTVDEPMVLETSQERPAPVEPGTPSAAPPAAASAAPPAVRPAEPAAEFELETAYEAAGMQWQGGGAAAAAPASPGVEAAPEPPRTEPPASVPPEAAPASVSFSPVVPPDVEGVGERTIADVPAPFVEAEQTVAERTFEYAFGAPRAAVTPEVEPAPEPPPSASPPLPPLPEPVALAAAAPPPVPPPAPRAPLEATPPKAVPAAREDETELVSPTLAELYFNQGFPEKAIEVYRRLLEKEPGNERARARMAELQQPGAAPADAAGAPPLSDQARAARREALERTIERLESLRAALQKGAR